MSHRLCDIARHTQMESDRSETFTCVCLDIANDTMKSVRNRPLFYKSFLAVNGFRNLTRHRYHWSFVTVRPYPSLVCHLVSDDSALKIIDYLYLTLLKKFSQFHHNIRFLTNFITWSASSRWPSSLCCDKRKSGKMTVGKTHPTLFPWAVLSLTC